VTSRALHPCAVCGDPIPARPYQNNLAVRACGPACAHKLAYAENPDLEPHRHRLTFRDPQEEDQDSPLGDQESPREDQKSPREGELN
jgi:hypothetical protein